MEVSNDQATSTDDDKERVESSQYAIHQQECSPYTVLDENNREAPMSNKKSTKKGKAPKERNWLAVHAFQRSGAGHHGDKKKQRNKRACRGKVKTDK